MSKACFKWKRKRKDLNLPPWISNLISISSPNLISHNLRKTRTRKFIRLLRRNFWGMLSSWESTCLRKQIWCGLPKREFVQNCLMGGELSNLLKMGKLCILILELERDRMFILVMKSTSSWSFSREEREEDWEVLRLVSLLILWECSNRCLNRHPSQNQSILCWKGSKRSSWKSYRIKRRRTSQRKRMLWTRKMMKESSSCLNNCSRYMRKWQRNIMIN